MGQWPALRRDNVALAQHPTRHDSSVQVLSNQLDDYSIVDTLPESAD